MGMGSSLFNDESAVVLNIFGMASSRGVFRISKRGAKFSLATSAHTKGGQTSEGTRSHTTEVKL